MKNLRFALACLAFLVLGIALLQVPALAQQRRLAPGVLTTIPPAPEDVEMFSGPRPLVEVLAIPDLDYKPNLSPKSNTAFERAKVSILRRTIWNLEFSFKPFRMVEVEMPQANGKIQKKLIWYMVYKVKNNGGHWKPAKKPLEPKFNRPHEVEGKETTNTINVLGKETDELRFFPHFVLDAVEFNKQYLDRVIPAAMGPIRAREFPGDNKTPLYDSQSITEVAIPVSTPDSDKSVWGVVMWEDVDPRTDYFSIYIQGLTNAYQYEDPAGKFKAGDVPGSARQTSLKTLRLNFWRPGDAIAENEGEVRYGMRIDADAAEQAKVFGLFKANERLDSEWIYRPLLGSKAP
ncbi:hypothetical protein [Anatilimnocola floriformis]|uniref:hypothetical protein n=1 Tax=Anatilimnocola floriformis TaxID=2948575 RepID=UPI0020C31A03|nr:hypothetical protein [Anatilimnocola floriformis]